MQSERLHLSNQELLLAFDRELPSQKAKEVESHLEACWSCKARLREIERTIGDFIEVRERSADGLPPAHNARVQLKAELAALAKASRPALWPRISLRRLERRSVAMMGGVLLMLAIITCSAWYRSVGGARPEARALPNPQITPGATLPLTQTDVCAGDIVESARLAPASVAHQVFASYGIREPEPRAYEVDYLITPALGGSDHIRNFWPQPYRDTAWNAHIKDALEDHLHRLVCGGKLDLRTAQHEIAQDWIRAYKKYFRTKEPLAEHSSFLKDRPWE